MTSFKAAAALFETTRRHADCMTVAAATPKSVDRVIGAVFTTAFFVGWTFGF
jgi:hypothetical protein